MASFIRGLIGGTRRAASGSDEAARGVDEATDVAETTGRSAPENSSQLARRQPPKDSTTVNVGDARRAAETTTQRSGSSSRLVGTAKWTAIGATGYAGATQGLGALQEREARKTEQAETERFEEYQARRQQILQSDLDPDTKREQLEALREDWEATQGDGDGGGGLLGTALGDLGLFQKFALFLALIIVYSVVRKRRNA